MSSYPQPPIVPPWGELAQDSGDMVQPSNTQIEAGWPESSTPPARQYFNWLFFYLSLAVNYFLQRGISDYNAAQTYFVNAVTIGDDGNLYKSLQNNNSGNTPSTSPSWWAQCGLTVAALEALFAPINSPVFTGTPEAPTPGSTDNSTKLATTAFVQAFINSANLTSGYFYLGPILIQFGSTTVSGVNKSVSFPIAFPNACLFVMTGSEGSSYNANSSGLTSASAFELYAGSGTYWWFAIGH